MTKTERLQSIADNANKTKRISLDADKNLMKKIDFLHKLTGIKLQSGLLRAVIEDAYNQAVEETI